MRGCVLLAFAAVLSVSSCTETPDPQQKLAEAKQQLAEAQQKVAAAEAEAVKQPAAPAVAPAPVAKAPEPPPKPQPISITLPAGTAIPIRTTGTISTRTHKGGDTFAATLNKDLVVDGKTIAKRGAEVTGVISDSDAGGRVKGKASISVRVKSIAGVEGPVAVNTGSYMAVAKSTVKRDVVRGGIMAGAGAAIGAIVGGGKGAAIGAGAGGAAGTGTAMATRGDPAIIPAEAALTLKTTAPVTLTLQP